MDPASELPEVVITGSTGALGGLVASSLASAGVPQRLLARTPAKAPRLDGAVAVPFSCGDLVASRTALEDVTTLFMVSAAESADRQEQHRTFIRAAAEAGVQHIVYTSFYGASLTCTFTLGRDHAATEQAIRDSGMTFTFLRDNFYQDIFPLFISGDGVLAGPAGTGRVAAVAREDVARVATRVLRDPSSHQGVTYDLTGPQALTLNEIAQIIAAAQGRKVTFHNETVEEAYESRRRWDVPQWQYDAWVSTYTAIAAGELDGVTDDVHRVTGREPLRFTDFMAAQARSTAEA